MGLIVFLSSVTAVKAFITASILDRVAKQTREVEKLFGLARHTFGRRFGNLIFATHFRQRSQMRTTETDGSGNVCWDIGLGSDGQFG